MRGSFKNRQKRKAEAKQRESDLKEMQAESEALKQATALPDGVIHIPLQQQSAVSLKGLSDNQSLHLTLFPGVILCFTIYGTPWSVILMASIYMIFFAKPDKMPADLGGRKGLLISPEQITFADLDGNEEHFKRTENMRLQCDPTQRSLTLSSSDPSSKALTLDGFNNIGTVATALEKWIDESSEKEKDPTEAERQGHWLSIMSRAMIYRKQLPADFVAAMPPYPYETTALQSFAEQLKTHEVAMLRRDSWVKLRTALVCLLGILLTTILGVNRSLETARDWAPLLPATLLQLKMTLVQIRAYDKNKATRGFYRHGIATFILMAIVPYLLLF